MNDDAARAAAIRLYHCDGHTEIDNDPETTVSWTEFSKVRGEVSDQDEYGGIEGAYVKAWVWVPMAEIEKELRRAG